MANVCFPAAGPLSSVAVAFAISISLNTMNLGGAQAEPRYHCPSGQIYRVSKKICVPKGSAFGPLTPSQKSEELPVASSAPNRVEGSAQTDAAPPISSIDELLATIEEPKAQEAETPRIEQPETATPSKSPEFNGHPDAVLQARLAQESETSALEEAVAFYREALKQQNSRGRAAQVGRDPEQSCECPCGARGTGELERQARRGRGVLSRGAEGRDSRARAARMGDDREQSGPSPCNSRGTGDRDHEALGGPRRQTRGARLGHAHRQSGRRAHAARRTVRQLGNGEDGVAADRHSFRHDARWRSWACFRRLL